MKIALIGSAPSSVRLGPYKDKSFADYAAGRPQLERHQFPYVGDEWEIWGCSPGVFGVAERANRWFEMHRWEPGQTWFSPEYCDFLRSFKGPVYTGEVIPEIPNSVRVPREEIVARFSPYFLTSSLSFMFAVAILEIEQDRKTREFPEEDVIGMWGVDMAATEEYGYQRAGCQYFFLECDRRGIEVVIPPESDIVRPMPMYGLSEWSHAHIKNLARLRELQGRHQSCQQAIQQATTEMHFLAGAIENMEYMMKTWVLTEHSPECLIGPNGAQLLNVAEYIGQ